MQLSFFNLDDPLLEEIKEEIGILDINTLTPVGSIDEVERNKANVVKNNLFCNQSVSEKVRFLFKSSCGKKNILYICTRNQENVLNYTRK